MKCLILAGGRGERLWPLSRKNYPKQFISIQNNHSIFQETVARNVPYCDEFIIVTSFEYRYIIESQMAAFQGTAYRCIYEEAPLKTAAAIILACRDLPMSELIFAVASNHLLDSEEGLGDYKDSVLRAKRLAVRGRNVTFGIEKKNVKPYMGFIKHEGENVTEFIEKPADERFIDICSDDRYLRNSGMYLFEVGVFQNELKNNNPQYYEFCQEIYRGRHDNAGFTVYGGAAANSGITDSLEKVLIERSGLLSVVPVKFGWKDITRLEDISVTDYQQKGPSVAESSHNTTVFNNSKKQFVVVNGIDDVLVVNTQDAVYIGKYGCSSSMKKVLSDHPEIRSFGDKSTIFYRTWGFYEDLIVEPTYRVRRVTLNQGKSIFPNKHKMRSENWTMVEGSAVVILDGKRTECKIRMNIDVPIDVEHQISNIGEGNAVFIETAVGSIVHEEDSIATKNAAMDVGSEPFVKLRPAFKDYLWGGTKLRDIYGKQCDLDIIAESWELSAHPAGQSIVASGRFRGMPFGVYLSNIGKEGLGWKIQPGADFPLLVKFIDAKGNLSVQVHPGDDYALEHEYGKNEMWYVVDCEPGSHLYVGFNRDVSREEVEERVNNNTILEILNEVTTHPGDVFFIPAGTVHAIGEGNLICEIQQSSNCTYRLYDYERRDKYGNPRELHIQKALDVLDYGKYRP